MATKVLVTGCAGHIGSLLVQELLAYKHKVVGVDSLAYGEQSVSAMLPFISNRNFDFWKMDVRDNGLKNLVKNSDVVIPLAALVGPVCNLYPLQAKQINEMAIKRIVEALSPDQLIVYPNTNSIYGHADSTIECDEDSPTSPISVYGLTKHAGEGHVVKHPNHVVLRLATLFGLSPRPRMDLLLNNFVKELTHTSSLKIFEGHFMRNFVGINDVVFGFVSAAEGEISPGVYNFGNDDANVSKLELAHIICDTIGLDRSVVQNGRGSDPDKRNYIVSNKKILSQGFLFEHSMAEGISQMHWYCQNTPLEILNRKNNMGLKYES